MTTSKIHNIQFQHPSHPNELTTRQLLWAVDIIHAQIESNIARSLITLTFFYGNLKLTWFFFKNQYLIPFFNALFFNKIDFVQYEIEADEWTELIQETTAIITDPKLLLTTQKLPKIKVKTSFFTHKILIGPASRLENIIFAEFVIADFYFLMYQKTTEQKYLDKFIATLYRPQAKTPNQHGDKRTKFDETKIETNTILTAKLPQNIKNAIIYFYDGCRTSLVNSHDHLFPEKLKSNIEDTKKAETTIAQIINHYEDWDKVPYDFAHSPADVAQQKQTLLTEVFKHLDNKIRRNKEELEALKKLKK